MSTLEQIKADKQKESVWIIRHKETKELLKVPSGKTSWCKQGHAKNAWGTFNTRDKQYLKVVAKKLQIDLIEEPSRYSDSRYNLRFPKFDEQDTWELYDAGKDYGNTAVELLTKCLGRLTDRGLEREIGEFLGK